MNVYSKKSTHYQRLIKLSHNFSKLDANSGSWKIQLAKQSQKLTTFITSAPQHFQKWMSTILSGLEGVQCLMHHVPVYGKYREEHNQYFTKANLEQI